MFKICGYIKPLISILGSLGDKMELLTKLRNRDNRKSFVAKLWIAGSCSSTIIIPKQLAEKYHLCEPCHVSFEPQKEGILMRKILDN